MEGWGHAKSLVKINPKAVTKDRPTFAGVGHQPTVFCILLVLLILLLSMGLRSRHL